MTEATENKSPKELLTTGVTFIQKVAADQRAQLDQLSAKLGNIDELKERAQAGVEKLQGQVSGKTGNIREQLDQQLEQLRGLTAELNVETVKSRGEALTGEARERVSNLRGQIDTKISELKETAETRGGELKKTAKDYRGRLQSETLLEDVKSRIEVARTRVEKLDAAAAREVLTENVEKARGRVEAALEKVRAQAAGLNTEALRTQAGELVEKANSRVNEVLSNATEASGVATRADVSKLPSRKDIEKLILSIDLSALARATQLDSLAKAKDLKSLASKKDVEASLKALGDQLNGLTDEIRVLNKQLALASSEAA